MIEAICSSSNSTSGDKSMPPTRGSTRRIGVKSGAHSRSITSDMTEWVGTQDKTA